MVRNISNLDPKAKTLLHVISVIGTYMVFFGIFFIALDHTLGLIPGFKEIVLFGKIPLYYIVYSLIDIGVIKKFLTISSPYKVD